MPTKKRNVEHVRVGDGLWWCGRWVVVYRVVPHMSIFATQWIELTVQSETITRRVLHYKRGERVVSSRRRFRNEQKARVAMLGVGGVS